MYDDDYAVDPPTDNHTSLSPEGVDGLSPKQAEKYKYLNMTNTGLYNGTRRDSSLDNAINNREQFHVIAGHFDLTISQRQRSEFLFVEMPDPIRVKLTPRERAIVCCHHIRSRDARGRVDHTTELFEQVVEISDINRDAENLLAFYDGLEDHISGEQWVNE